jgi:hypothetical protein
MSTDLLPVGIGALQYITKTILNSELSKIIDLIWMRKHPVRMKTGELEPKFL